MSTAPQTESSSPSPPPPLLRQTLRLVVLAVAFAVCYLLAYLLHEDFILVGSAAELFWATLPWVVVVKLAVAYVTQGLHGWMRYVAFYDLVHLGKAAFLATVMLLITNFALLADRVPFTVILIDFLLTVFIIGGLRSLGRFTRELFWPLIRTHLLRRDDRRRILLVGANRVSIMLVNQINFPDRPGLWGGVLP